MKFYSLQNKKFYFLLTKNEQGGNEMEMLMSLGMVLLYIVLIFAAIFLYLGFGAVTRQMLLDFIVTIKPDIDERSANITRWGLEITWPIYIATLITLVILMITLILSVLLFVATVLFLIFMGWSVWQGAVIAIDFFWKIYSKLIKKILPKNKTC